ncbi:hypothetical protein EV658_1279 [Phaeovulum veldkampii DSM 11550]|uniref:hypothetical protein n=1 Tax=Phaeovulum veldkampii TaxID=33049 RepID=UPI0010619322|nr:hypothetical protein [Phaeovulum veldkampii]TDQ55583.1 hypothetical protein EV658_1279 [Phaeovulum veldkampii DSM 11550]
MKPSFALNLSHDGIGLLHRAAAGWVPVGAVALNDPALGPGLTQLRKAAQGMSSQGLTTKLVIPNSQILYLQIEAPGPSAAQRRRQIATALEGRTPYDVADLVFDWSGTGAVVQVAVVARETLTEAEAFAEQHRFNPLCFVAIPEPGTFAAEPWFGLTTSAPRYLPEGGRLDRDQDPIQIIAPPDAAEPDPVPEVEATPEPAPLSPETVAAPPEAVAEPQHDAAAADVARPEPTPEENPAAEAPGTEPSQPLPADTPEPVAPATAPAAPSGAPRLGPVGGAVNSGKTKAALPKLGAAAPADAGAARGPKPIMARPIGPGAGITAPGLALPDLPPAPPEPAAPPARAALGAAAKGTAALGGAAGKALARGLMQRVNIKHRGTTTPAAVPAHAHATEPKSAAEPERTVFGRLPQPVPRGRARLGLVLTGALVLFLGAVALWSSLLETDEVARPLAPAIPAPIAQPLPTAPQPTVAVVPQSPAPAQVEMAEAAPSPAVPPSPAPEAAPEPRPLAQAPAAAQPMPFTPLAPPTQDMLLAALAPVVAPDTSPLPASPVPLPGTTPPTAEGVETAAGVMLFAGRPPVVTGPRPTAVSAAAVAAATAATLPYADPALARFRPKPRPEGLAPAASPAPAPTPIPAPVEPTPPADATTLQLDRPALAPPAGMARPRTRPQSVVETARAQAAAAAAVQAELDAASRLAVERSLRPMTRPQDFSGAVERALAAAAASAPPPPAAEPAPTPEPSRTAKAPEPPVEDEIDEPEPTSAAPSIPTSASVARQATLTRAIDLGKINLIGLYGSSSDRRALVRMPNGRFVKVQIGDRLDGGKVAAIGDGKLTYVKNGKNIVLKLVTGG